jgi:hypothetical protein
MYCLGTGWAIRVEFLAEAQILSSTPCIPTVFRAHQASCLRGTVGCLPISVYFVIYLLCKKI